MVSTTWGISDWSYLGTHVFSITYVSVCEYRFKKLVVQNCVGLSPVLALHD